MTPAELKDKVQAVVDEVNMGAGVAAGVFAPLIPYVVIAKAVDQFIPGIVGTVDAWIQGTPPTDEELADFAAKLGVLSNPDLP